MLVFMIMY